MAIGKIKKQLIWLIPFFLLIVILGLNSFFLLDNSPLKTIKSNSNSLSFYELSILLNQNSSDDLAFLKGISDLKPQLEQFGFASLKKKRGALIFTNHQPFFVSELTEPITINYPFRLLINFDVQNTDSVLIISGKENLNNNQWWQNIHQLRIGYHSTTNSYYFQIFNGQSQKSVWYDVLKNLQPGESFIIEFFDARGTKFNIIDSDNNILTTVNLFNNSQLKMKYGLFPFSNLKIGISLTPNEGKLILRKLYLYQVK